VRDYLKNNPALLPREYEFCYAYERRHTLAYACGTQAYAHYALDAKTKVLNIKF